DLNGVFERTCRNHSRDWSKYLFLGDAHVGSRIDKHGRLDEVSVGVVTLREPSAAASQLGAIFITSDTDIAHDLFDRIVVDDRPNVSLWIGAVADAQCLCVIDELRDELFIDFL